MFNQGDDGSGVSALGINAGVSDVFSDGINWIHTTLSGRFNNMHWKSVTWSPLGRFVAVAGYGTGTINKVMYSSDGISWSQPTLSTAINSVDWNSVTWSPG